MTNEIDRLMSLDPLELSAQDIDSIIAYHRKNRLAVEAGLRPKRGQASAPINLEEIGLVPKAPAIKKRKL